VYSAAGKRQQTQNCTDLMSTVFHCTGYIVTNLNLFAIGLRSYSTAHDHSHINFCSAGAGFRDLR
jgi:hypothetical protein